MSHASISGVPFDTTCWFALTVRSGVKIASNSVSCYRNKSVTSSSTYSSISPTSSFMTAQLFTTNVSPTLSSLLSKSPFLKTTLFTPDASPSLIQSSTVLSMSLSTFSTSPSLVIFHSNTSNIQSPLNNLIYILLVVVITLLTLSGILAAVFVMRKRNNSR